MTVQRLARELRTLRGRAGAAGGGAGGSGGRLGAAPGRLADGDHAMLSGRPILGFRCLACDRPLEKLDERPGPYLPTGGMKPQLDPLRSLAVVPESAGPAPAGLIPARGSPGRKAAYDALQRRPQTWYENGRNTPAEGLPKQDVGPKLEKGGWRRLSASGSHPGALPLIG